MSEFVIWHNPRCSKSRATLALLRENGVEPRIIEYLETPPDPATLRQVLTLLRFEPRDLIRKQEAVYSELGLDEPSLSDAALLRAMSENPILIERPVVMAGSRACVGRPPEKVLELLR